MSSSSAERLVLLSIFFSLSFPPLPLSSPSSVPHLVPVLSDLAEGGGFTAATGELTCCCSRGERCGRARRHRGARSEEGRRRSSRRLGERAATGEHRVRSLSSVSSVPSRRSLSSVRGGRGAPLVVRRRRGSASGAAQGSSQIQVFFFFSYNFFKKNVT